MARPNLSYLKNLILFLFGLPLGMLTGLTAIAGSVFAVPAVRSLLGLRPARAVGVGLAVTFFAAFASLLSYAQHGFVLGWLALLLAVCQVVGAAWGGRMAARLPVLDRLPWLWGALVVAGGLGMLAQGMGQFGSHVPWHADFAHRPWLYPEAALIAVAVGVVSRVLGLGGVLMVPAAIYGLGMPPHAAQGTALVVLALASLPGTLIHARRGDVEPQAATWLSAGAVFGGLSGALWAVTTLTDRGAVLLFGLMLVISGLMLLWRKEVVVDPSNSEVKQTAENLESPTVSDLSPVSPRVAPEPPQKSTSQTAPEASEPLPAHVSEDNEDIPKTIPVKAEPAAISRVVLSQQPTAKDVLEQKLRKLEEGIASKTLEPEERPLPAIEDTEAQPKKDAGSSLTRETNAETTDGKP